MMLPITALVALLVSAVQAYPTLEHLERLAGEQLDSTVQEELRSRVVETDSPIEVRAPFDPIANKIDGKSVVKSYFEHRSELWQYPENMPSSHQEKETYEVHVQVSMCWPIMDTYLTTVLERSVFFS